jgi:hypothetical protein
MYDDSEYEHDAQPTTPTPHKSAAVFDPSQPLARREKLPFARPSGKSVSMWSLIKARCDAHAHTLVDRHARRRAVIGCPGQDAIGKDLGRICLPVFFNEPISILQKACEGLEYASAARTRARAHTHAHTGTRSCWMQPWLRRTNSTGCSASAAALRCCTAPLHYAVLRSAVAVRWCS